jgi:hypothetical protein
MHVLIRHNTTVTRCDCMGTLWSPYKDMQKHQQPTTVTAQVLTVKFRQPSYEFTFNVGVDLLF